MALRSIRNRHIAHSAVAVLYSALACASHAATTCNVRAFGALGDGVRNDTHSLQAAIDTCAKRGGGTVLLTAGTYQSGPIVLKSDITLELASGATLLGSPAHSDYPAITEFRAPGLQALVSATNASHIAITGKGIINGNGESWWLMAHKLKDTGIMGSSHPRPRLIVFDHCTHVLLQGVTIENSPMWQVVPYYSDDVVIRDVTILAPPHSPNTDGIDPFSSSHVSIERVVVDVGDDDVAIKSGEADSPGPDAPSRDITILHCVFRHGHGLSIGSEIAGGASDVDAEDIQFEGTDNGIRIKANRDRGNDVGNLHFQNIHMQNVKRALVISEFYPKIMPPDPDTAAPVTRLTPHFHDITIENLTATGGMAAGAIAGLPEAPIRNVVLNNVHIVAEKGLAISNAQVTGSGVVIHASDGLGIVQLAGARVSLSAKDAGGAE